MDKWTDEWYREQLRHLEENAVIAPTSVDSGSLVITDEGEDG